MPRPQTDVIVGEKGKEKIKPIENPLEKVLGLYGVIYTPTGNKVEEVGMLAHYCESVFPEAIKDVGFAKVVINANLIPLLVEAIKELDGVVKAQQKKIQTLEKRGG